VQEVHKLKRDHPTFLPKMQALAFDQVRTMRMEKPFAEYPSWYNIQVPDRIAAIGAPPIQAIAEDPSQSPLMESVAGVAAVESQKGKALTKFKGAPPLIG
jgi:hypothetical protein